MNKVVKTNYLKILFEKEVSFSPRSGFSDVSVSSEPDSRKMIFKINLDISNNLMINDKGVYIDVSKKMQGNTDAELNNYKVLKYAKE